MPIDSKHPALALYEGTYKEIETIISGEDAVKAAGTAFVPELGGQDTTAYKKYIQRGSYFNATAKTVTIMTGAAMRKRPTIEAQENVLEKLKSCTQSGESIETVIQQQYDQVISYARFGVLVDYDGSSPYLSTYDRNTILNWREEIIDGKLKLTMLVLKEYLSTPNPADTFELDIVVQYRHFFIDESGYLQVDTWREDESEDGKIVHSKRNTQTKQPSRLGKRLGYIPFVCFGPNSLTMALEKSPIEDLVKLNIAHWRVSVDYFHGLHYCAIPTPWAAGFNKDEILRIGGSTAWVTEEPQASAGYLEFTGQGLQPVMDALDKLETLMAVAGTRLIEHSKKTIERAETLRIRSSGDSATLSSIANTAEKGFNKVIEYFSEWMGVDKDFRLTLNKDFLDIELSSDQLIALLKAVQLGEISQETFLYNLKLGEILPDGVSIQTEKELIQKDMAERKDLIKRIMDEKGITVGEDDDYFQDDFNFSKGKGQISKAVEKDIT